MKQRYALGNSTTVRNAPPMPSDWEKGFGGWNKDASNPRYRPACGGKEIPVYYPAAGWTLLLWDTLRHKRALYLYSCDHIVYDIENYI